MPKINSMQAARSQFDAFTSFAKSTGVGGRTTVQIGQSGGAISSIKAKSTLDFIGNIGRGERSRGTNDAVRALFKESVVKMFGGTTADDVACLPESVRTAMRLDDDYGKGKPLTARRILAVQTAVRQNTIENTLTAAGIALDDVVRARIKTAVAACGTDEDAFAVLQETWKEVLFVNGDKIDDPTSQESPVPRGAWSVRSKVGALVSDIQSLRKATGGDQNLFDAAKPFLALKGRAPLPTSLLVNMVSAVQQLKPNDLAPIAELAQDPVATDAHKAAVKLGELVNGAMAKSGLGNVNGFSKTPRNDYREQLLACMILAKAIPDKTTRDKVHAFFQSDEVRALKKVYQATLAKFQKDAKAHGNATTNHLLATLGDVYLHLSISLNTLKRAVDQMHDGVLSQEQGIKSYDGEVDFDSVPVQMVAGDMMKMSKDAQSAALNSR